MTPRLARRTLRLTGIDPLEVRTLLHQQATQQPYPLDLDAPFLWLGQHDWLPLRLAFTHFLVTGRSGSGKTSAIFPALVAAYMRRGFGLLCCTYKADDTALLVDLARRTGREDSLIVVTEGGRWRHNIIEGILAEYSGPEAATNATDVLMEAVKNRAEGGQRKEGEAIWNDATARHIRQGITLLQTAGLPVTLHHIKRLGDTLPTRHAMTGELVWPEGGGFLWECLQRAQRNPQADPDTMQAMLDYYTHEMTRPGASRFVSSVLANFVNSFDPFLAPGPARDLFFSDKPSTFSPMMSRYGAMIILDLPASTGGEAARTAQLLFKATWINAMLRTQGLPEPGMRPVAFICDEYQRLCTPRDTLLCEAGRSSLISALCLTQNIPNMFKAFGPSASEKSVYSLLSGFGTYIACQNHCPETAEFLAKVAGKDRILRQSGGTSQQASNQQGRSSGSSSGGSSSGSGGGSSWNWSSQTSSGRSESSGTNTGWREEMDFRLQPVVFQHLRPGGAPHYSVDALVYASGYRFHNGLPYVGATFPQTRLPGLHVPPRKGWRWRRR